VLSPTQLDKVGPDGFSREPVCVGPFMFDHRVAGDSITVIKSPYYFDRGHVYLDKIVFKYLSDASAAAALKAGDIQVVDSISPTELASVRSRSSLKTIDRAAFGYVSVEFNLGNRNGMGQPPYSNIGTPWSRSALLRQAFEEAIDRAKLARVVMLGAVQPGCTPVAPSSAWFDGSIPCTPYDPAHAKKLVAASGIRNPTLHLRVGSDDDTRRLAQFIAVSEKAVGIEVVIDTDASGSSGITAGRYESVLGAWAGGNDPDRNLYLFLATKGSRNRVGYSNQRFDVILENGRKAMSGKARRTLYRAAQRIVLADRPMIYLYHPIQSAGVDTSRVSGVEFFPDTQLRVIHAQLT
jgi:peptide/nickel transport system substrate-binding protein